MDQKGKRLCDTLKRQGYKAVSFGERKKNSSSERVFTASIGRNARIEGCDPVQEKKGLTMRKEFFDLFDVQFHR